MDLEKDSGDNGIANDSNDHSKDSTLKRWLRQILVTLALILGIFIAALSETAVSTVTETIAKELSSFGSLTWIAGGYMMTVVAFSPLFGKFSDIFGRKPVELFAIVVFFAGSLGCALSSSMNMLIAFRVIAGIGGGGLMSMSFIMVSDVISIQHRAQYLAMISLVFAFANILGPILGGLIAETSWRVIFYILLPLCVILSGLVLFVLPLPTSGGEIGDKLKRIDYLGSVTLIITIVLLMLLTTWGGKDYSWGSTPMIVLYVLLVIFFVGFIVIQWKFSKEPILPSRVFNRNIILANVANFCGGMVNFVAVFYLPVYYSTVKNLSPSQSGYQLIPFLISISIFCLLSAYLTRFFKTIRGVMWVGGVILVIGVCLIFFMRLEASTGEQIAYIVIVGIGLGLLLQLLMLICQISVPPEDVAISTAFNPFTMNIGGVIGLAIAGSVYNNVLVNQLKEFLPQLTTQDLLNSEILKTLSEEAHHTLNQCYFQAFRYGFVCLIPFSIICLISLLGLEKVELPKNSE